MRNKNQLALSYFQKFKYFCCHILQFVQSKMLKIYIFFFDDVFKIFLWRTLASCVELVSRRSHKFSYYESSRTTNEWQTLIGFHIHAVVRYLIFFLFFHFLFLSCGCHGRSPVLGFLDLPGFIKSFIDSLILYLRVSFSPDTTERECFFCWWWIKLYISKIYNLYSAA